MIMGMGGERGNQIPTPNANARNGNDEQLVTKMGVNEQRDITEMLRLKEEQALEDIELDDNLDCESLNKELPFCRFCWVNETTEENPLISSCKCRGGVQYIHFGCLKEWVKTKRSQKEYAHISTYLFRQFECEICKTPYPFVIKAGGKKYNLVDIPVQEPRPALAAG